MRSLLFVGTATLAALGAAAGSAFAVDDSAGGKQFLTSCGTCHTIDPGAPHRQGPNLHAVYGRAAGALPDFAYSETLKAGGWTWTEETLDPWLENAQAAHPGTTMNYRQRDAAKRALIIEYLKSRSAADAHTPAEQG
jgi:cytochrome c